MKSDDEGKQSNLQTMQNSWQVMVEKMPSGHRTGE
jgi:hypothetical protein